MTEFRSALIAAILSLALVSCGEQAPPRVVQATAPDFPRIAQAAHIEGDMVVAVDIAPDGSVSNAQVVSGPALREMREGSLAAARQWVFARSSKQLQREVLTFEFKVEGELNKDGQEVKFLPPDRLLVTVHPLGCEDPEVTLRHPKHK